MGLPHPLPGASGSPLFRTLLLTARISPQLGAQGCQVGSLKSAMGVFPYTNPLSFRDSTSMSPPSGTPSLMTSPPQSRFCALPSHQAASVSPQDR